MYFAKIKAGENGKYLTWGNMDILWLNQPRKCTSDLASIQSIWGFAIYNKPRATEYLVYNKDSKQPVLMFVFETHEKKERHMLLLINLGITWKETGTDLSETIFEAFHNRSIHKS